MLCLSVARARTALLCSIAVVLLWKIVNEDWLREGVKSIPGTDYVPTGKLLDLLCFQLFKITMEMCKESATVCVCVRACVCVRVCVHACVCVQRFAKLSLTVPRLNSTVPFAPTGI